jgi:hypothetical protein
MVVVGGRRTDALRNCDKIIVLKQGEKVEEGTHGELMQVPVEFEMPPVAVRRRRVIRGYYHHWWERLAVECAEGKTDSAALQLQISALEEELATKRARADELRRKVMLPFFAAIWVARFPSKVRRHRLRRLRRKKTFVA